MTEQTVKMLRRASLALLPALFYFSTGLADTHEIEMVKYQFVPREITIKVGDTVRWVNKERRQYHTIWFRDLGEKETQEWFPGESYERTFDAPGDFPYLCGPHHDTHDMKGVIHVVE